MISRGHTNSPFNSQLNNILSNAKIYLIQFYKVAFFRDGPKLVVFLHPSAESGRLGSDSLSPEFRSLALLYAHVDNYMLTVLMVVYVLSF